jgi:hypothetical protein
MGARALSVVGDGRYCKVKRAADNRVAVEELLCLACDHDEAVRAAVLRNSAFALHADWQAGRLLEHPTHTWVSRQAVAGSTIVSPKWLRRVFVGRELYVLLELVNNRSCPRDILKTIADEKLHEKFNNTQQEDEKLPTDERYDHRRRVYKALWEIAQNRLRLGQGGV